MSFLGKWYKRIKYENLEELLQATGKNKDISRILSQNPPAFCYTKVSENTYNFILDAEGRNMSFNFILDEEQEVEKRDGSKVNILYTMPRDNIINQVITLPDGQKVYFSREFSDGQATMTVTMDGTDIKAIVNYEAVE